MSAEPHNIFSCERREPLGEPVEPLEYEIKQIVCLLGRSVSLRILKDFRVECACKEVFI